MSDITLTWGSIYYPVDAQYGTNAWINEIQWRTSQANGKTLIPTGAGLYVIEDSAQTVLYAGQAQNFRERFDGRSDVFRDFDLRKKSIKDISIYICKVAPRGTLSLAERWLVRILYLRDAGLNPRTLQNINLTVPFFAPESGLTIENTGDVPTFLDEDYSDKSDQKI